MSCSERIELAVINEVSEYNNGKDHWDKDFKKKNTTTAGI